MATGPLIGVVMPVFNGQRYLAPTIEAILEQTYRNFQFVIVDDGSTDNSMQIVERYAKKDERIIVLEQRNSGISQALNAGISMVTAPYVAPVDQDDISLPSRLEAEVALLEAESDVVCVSGWYQIIDGKGRYLTTLRTPSGNDNIQQIALTGACPICHSGCMMRKSAVLKVGGYDPAFDLAQDLDLFLRLGEVGRLENLDIPVLKYRLHDSASSEKRGTAQRERARLACERAWSRRGISGIFEATELWRPGPSPESRHKFMLMYGWWAFNSHQRKTAIVYAGKAIRAIPSSLDGWKLLVSALTKRFDKSI